MSSADLSVVHADGDRLQQRVDDRRLGGEYQYLAWITLSRTSVGRRARMTWWSVWTVPHVSSTPDVRLTIEKVH